MNYRIVPSEDFKREIKALLKKYRSISADVAALKKGLLANPTMGESLGAGAYKVRMAIASKGGGKRGGARVITCIVLINTENTKIYLLTIYDKGEQDTITLKEIKKLKQKNELR